ncbi:MAG: aspartate/glutamate racemase family protein [Pseudomonadota bacterium]
MTNVGFISPPNWFDPSPQEFAALCAEPVGTQQFPLPLFGFTYRLSSIARTQPEQLLAARTLGACRCDAIAVCGTPFGWAGLSGEDEARAGAAQLTAAAGVPVVLTGTSIADALRALGAGKIALAPTYYDEDWKAAWKAFISGCGFNVVINDSLADQGIMPEKEIGSGNTDTLGQATVCAAVEAIAANPRGAEAIVVTGAGCRTNLYIDELERLAGMPVIGSDTAVFWALAKAAGVPLKTGALGALTDF